MSVKRKVFISVLGTGNYGECTYKKGDFEFKTKFIQEATLRYLHRDELWEEDSDVYILLTDKAREKNWDSSGSAADGRGLREVLDKMKIKSRIHDITIKEGKDEDELWDIFNTVFGLLKDGDELHFDLTHGLRYLPMLVLVLGNYAKFLKGVSVKSITYGNWEMRETGKPGETPIAPIIDLLPLAALQDWTSAAADFVENGSASRMSKLGRTSLIPLLSASRGADAAASGMRAFLQYLDTFIDDIRLCRGVELHSGDDLRKVIDSDCSDSRIAPLQPIIKDVINSLEGFSPDGGSLNILKAARWCYGKKLYQQAITEALEGIVTFFCDRYGLPVNEECYRNYVYEAFTKRGIELLNANNKRQRHYTPNPGMDEVLIYRISQDEYLKDDKLVSFFENLRSNVRNDINHCGMRPEPLKAKNIMSALKDIGQIIGTLSKKLPLHTIEAPAKHKLLVNLSNHPSTGWVKEQLDAAKAYGEVMDMPFPMVSPTATEEDLKLVSDELTQTILGLAKYNSVTVHVMGEMNLTFSIVSMLLSNGIPCIASTTERVTEDLPDGSKRSEFQFKKFRNYA